MDQPKNKFLAELAIGLGNHQDKDSILLEYETHIDEIILEAYDCKSEAEVIERITSRLGSPEEIALAWEDELSVTPSNMKWLFISINILFFGGGSTLTLVHNLYKWKWLSIIWDNLTTIPIVISFVYMIFWALLGYEIGKGFGYGGRKLLNKTFFVALIPNLTLMFLTVLEIVPHSWFAPLLTKTFIIACIIFTITLYPVSWIGYLWGKKASI
ncbi:HAAS signaling domain-containing protein [Bacillus sp. 1NLA3E]|uniref:HAAS signaling domain-containing protein n=1 Tax=Bacillus sp. 1NLA3E TaxID=666686 RepID=UPI000247F045|nr:membrane protein [Bacillus sp. 1NLA3E]AGK54004.1 integral inner membrane protein [Bacillus sp. 1NLA3E]